MGMEPFVQANAGAFGPLVQSMPDPLRDYEQQLAFKTGIDAQKAETLYKTAQVSAQAQKVQRQNQFAAAMQAYLAHPTAQGLAQIMGQFPEFADEAKSAGGAIDAETSKANLTQLGEVTSLASRGNFDKAAELLGQRIQADKEAGHVDPHDQLVYDLLSSGDPAKQKQALGLLTLGVAVAAGVEHAGSFLDVAGLKPDLMSVAPGAEIIDRRDPNSGAVYTSPYKPTTITGPDGTVYSLVPDTGGSAAPAGGGFDNAVSFVLQHEGGYNPSDRNGSPVNFGINQGANPDVNVRGLTQDQAKQLYLDRYWKPSGAENLPPAMQTPYFDTYVLNPGKAKQILKASGGDPLKFVQLRRNWLKSLEKSGKYDKAWSERTDALEQMVKGSAPVQVKSKQQYDALPSGAHYIAPDGSLRVKG